MLADVAAVSSEVSFEHWLTLLGICLGIVVSLGIIVGFIWRTWRKQIRPYMDAQDAQREWIRREMARNGRAKDAGTDDLGIRDALDENTAATKSLEENLAALGAKFSEHLDWAGDEKRRTDEIEERQRTNVEWALAKFIEMQERLDAITHTDVRPPRLDPPEGD